MSFFPGFPGFPGSVGKPTVSDVCDYSPLNGSVFNFLANKKMSLLFLVINLWCRLLFWATKKSLLNNSTGKKTQLKFISSTVTFFLKIFHPVDVGNHRVDPLSLKV